MSWHAEKAEGIGHASRTVALPSPGLFASLWPIIDRSQRNSAGVIVHVLSSTSFPFPPLQTWLETRLPLAPNLIPRLVTPRNTSMSRKVRRCLEIVPVRCSENPGATIVVSDLAERCEPGLTEF